MGCAGSRGGIDLRRDEPSAHEAREVACSPPHHLTTSGCVRQEEDAGDEGAGPERAEKRGEDEVSGAAAESLIETIPGLAEQRWETLAIGGIDRD